MIPAVCASLFYIIFEADNITLNNIIYSPNVESYPLEKDPR